MPNNLKYQSKFNFALWKNGWSAITEEGRSVLYVAENPHAYGFADKYVGCFMNYDEKPIFVLEAYDELGRTEDPSRNLIQVLPPFARFDPGSMVMVWKENEAENAVMRRFIEFTEDFKVLAAESNDETLMQWDYVMSIHDYKEKLYKKPNWNKLTGL